MIPRRNRWPRFAAFAAAVGLAALGLWRMIPDRNPAAAGLLDSPAAEIATLVDARDCKWTDPPELAVGKGLSSGLIELESGVALIEFCRFLNG